MNLRDALRGRRSWACALALVLAAAGGVTAQEEREGATITGRVVQAGTGEPLASVQVVIPGTSRGTFTRDDGTYRLVDLAPGTYRVEARSVGYRTAARSVQVDWDATEVVNLELQVSVVPLSEVLITGQSTGRARREVGTSVVTINARDVQTTGMTSVAQMIQSRAPGVTMLPTGGKPGAGSRLVLRGVGTLTQTVEPLIYVDGVRIDNSHHTEIDFGGPVWSGIDDINPLDVDRIEIIRGAAATAVYGTEAAAGVVQIFTKQGGTKPQSWSLRSEFGVSNTPADWWDVSPHAREFHANHVGTGTSQRQYLSVHGTVDKFDYAASGTFAGSDGVLEGTGSDFNALRANMRVTPSQKVAVGLSTGYTRRGVDVPFDAAHEFGLAMNALGGGAEGVNVTPAALLEAENSVQASRFTGGAIVEYSPFRQFSHRLTAGVDVFDSNNRSFIPWGSELYEPGRIENDRRQSRTVTVEYSGSYDARLSETVQSRTFAGAQGYTRDEVQTYGRGLRFAGPGLSTISAAAATWSNESRYQSRGLGFYGEQQFGLNDRLFVTVGARADAHSSFGEDAGYQIYPKADVSYLVSDYDFWPEQAGTFRLRGAYGKAGQNPGIYLANRTWEMTRYNGWGSGLTTGNIGNPELRAEVSREVELGFDAGLFDERVNVEFTFYDQETTDALYPTRPVPSTGYVNFSLQNIGKVANRGFEVMARGRVLELPTFRWDAGLGFWQNSNEVVDLWSQPDVPLGGLQWLREGHPVGAYFGEDETFLGAVFPDRTLQLTSDARFGRNVRLNLLVDHKGGHSVHSMTLQQLDSIAAVADGGTFDTPAENYVVAADSWRLRELGLTYTVPSALSARIRAADASISLVGRNLWRSQEYGGLEAEGGLRGDLISQTYFATPLPRQFVAGVNLRF